MLLQLNRLTLDSKCYGMKVGVGIVCMKTAPGLGKTILFLKDKYSIK